MKQMNNISHEWLRLVRLALSSSNHELSPAIATISIQSNADVQEDAFQADLDRLLDSCGYDSNQTVASTIFPYFLWNPRGPRSEFFDRYYALIPIVRKRNPRGVYFERLMSYPGIKGQRGFNQLDRLITTYNRNNHRRSALQASLVDPRRDLNSDARVQGFPCLQQVGFLPDAKLGTVTIVAYYPIQYLLRRGFGNYLGLIRLGEFVGKETGLVCNKLICVAGVAKIEKHVSKVRQLSEKYLQVSKN